MAGTRSQKTTQKGSDGEPPQKRKASDKSTISDRTKDNVKYEKLRAKLAKVQAENGELKAFSSQVRGAKSAKALAKATMNTGVQTEILLAANQDCCLENYPLRCQRKPRKYGFRLDPRFDLWRGQK